jgi:hypothetical protein
VLEAESAAEVASADHEGSVIVVAGAADAPSSAVATVCYCWLVFLVNNEFIPAMC